MKYHIAFIVFLSLTNCSFDSKGNDQEFNHLVP